MASLYPINVWPMCILMQMLNIRGISLTLVCVVVRVNASLGSSEKVISCLMPGFAALGAPSGTKQNVVLDQPPCAG